jgi:hypothetical protein
MKTAAVRMSCIVTLLLIPGAFAMKEARAPDPQGRQGHLSGLTAKITLADGTIRTARIEGLGCSTAICSRVAIRGKADGDSLVSFWLDGLAAIRDTTDKDALIVMKSGAARRVSLVTDFRVLYLANRILSPEKLDLGKVKSLEFLPATN